MAFTRYPQSPNPPLSLAAAAAVPAVGVDMSDFEAFTEHVSGINMHIYLAMLGPAGGVHPQIFLRATSPAAAPGLFGPPTLIPYAINPANPGLLTDVDNETGSTATTARITVLPNAVYRIECFMSIFDDTDWHIQIQNMDGSSREFTWVVGDTASEAQQPWLDVTPDTLTYEVLINQTPATTAQTITVRNNGTGPLTVNGTLPALAPDFTVLTLPAGPVNPNGFVELPIEFNAPGTPGPTNAVTTIDLDPAVGTDADAGAVAGHNNQVTLNATTRELELAILLDDSGSMAWDKNGNSLPVGDSNSRWGQAASATNLFLDLLAIFAEASGTFGIARFRATNPVNPSTHDIVGPTNIGAPGTMAGAQGAVSAVIPSSGTHMGDGMNRVLNTGSYFNITTNHRWLLLFSDGEHNAGTFHPNDFLSPANGGTSVTSLADRALTVFTIGYGVPGASDVNHPLLANIAADSLAGGHTRQPNIIDATQPAELTPTDVANAISDAIKSGLIPALSSALDPRGVLTDQQPEARHIVNIIPYDTRVAFILNWNSANAERMRLQLLTPDCQLLTPELFDSSGSPSGVSFSGQERYQLYGVSSDYLQNAGNPRFGEWQLIVSSDALSAGDRENYTYEVIVESRLQMRVEFDRKSYCAGQPIGLTAYLTLDGKPITDATVTVEVNGPGQAESNWIAAVDVSPEEYQRSADILANVPDIHPLFIKAHAARLKDLVFNPFNNQQTLPMTDPDGRGVYSATFSDTQTPEAYNFYVTAVGTTKDGIDFRRELRLQKRVSVCPLPDFTLIEIVYTQLGDNILGTSLRFTPRDQFGNVQPLNPQIQLVTDDVEVAQPLTSNLDGSYSAVLHHATQEPPVINLLLNEQPIINKQRLAPVADLHYVDEIVDFTLGNEAEQGSNQFPNPEMVLGNPLRRTPDEMLALGGGGQVAVALNGHVILGSRRGDDITVFVQPDADPRAYVVEALDWRTQEWVEIGRSAGGTASFDMKRAHIRIALAVRVRDASKRTRDQNLKALSRPGVSLTGVGLRTVSKPHWLDCYELATADVKHLAGIGRKYAAVLQQAGIDTLAHLAGSDVKRVRGLSARRLGTLQEQCQMVLDTAVAIKPIAALEQYTIERILATPDAKLARETNLSTRTIVRLRKQLASLDQVLNKAYLHRLTFADLTRDR